MKWIVGIIAVMLIAHFLFKRERHKARRNAGDDDA